MLTGIMNMLIMGIMAALAFLVLMGARDALRGEFWLGLPKEIPPDDDEEDVHSHTPYRALQRT